MSFLRNSEYTTPEFEGVQINEEVDMPLFLLEQEENWGNLQLAMASIEHTSIITEKPELLTEGVKDYWEKVKEWFKKMWAAVKQFFKNVWMKISALWTNSAKWVAKYEKQIKAGAPVLVKQGHVMDLLAEDWKPYNAIDIMQALEDLVKSNNAVNTLASSDKIEETFERAYTGLEIVSASRKVTTSDVDMAMKAVINLNKVSKIITGYNNIIEAKCKDGIKETERIMKAITNAYDNSSDAVKKASKSAYDSLIEDGPSSRLDFH